MYWYYLGKIDIEKTILWLFTFYNVVLMILNDFLNFLCGLVLAVIFFQISIALK